MEDSPAIYQGQTTAGAPVIPAPVSSKYCQSDLAHFVIDQKMRTWSSGKFDIHDSTGQLVFVVRSKREVWQTKRVLYDPSGEAICLMRAKEWSLHGRWVVHRGDDESDSSVLFTVMSQSMLQCTSYYNVYLGNNQSGTPDFTVKGELSGHNYAIRYGDITAAEVQKDSRLASSFLGKDQYAVSVNPGVDRAFIATIIVIIDQIIQRIQS